MVIHDTECPYWEQVLAPPPRAAHEHKLDFVLQGSNNTWLLLLISGSVLPVHMYSG